MEITIERKESIDNIVKQLKPDFLIKRDFNPIFTKYNIDYYVNNSYPLICHEEENKKIILSHNFLFNITKESDIAHEVGHIVLNHFNMDITENSAEHEANYFSVQLTNHSLRKYQSFKIAENIFLFFTNQKFRKMSMIYVPEQDKRYASAMITKALKTTPIQY